MSHKHKYLLFWTLAAAVVVLWPELVWAGSGDWVKPSEGILTSLTDGLVYIGGPLLGLAIAGLGIWAGITGRMEWTKVGYVILGGIFVMAGPAAMKSLMEAVKS
jgi:type IV secretory pathway VirB2 component (pilin)